MLFLWAGGEEGVCSVRVLPLTPCLPCARLAICLPLPPFLEASKGSEWEEWEGGSGMSSVEAISCIDRGSLPRPLEAPYSARHALGLRMRTHGVGGCLHLITPTHSHINTQSSHFDNHTYCLDKNFLFIIKEKEKKFPGPVCFLPKCVSYVVRALSSHSYTYTSILF